MGNAYYNIVGKVTIPERKKEAFNAYVLKLLYLCGIRKTTYMYIGEQRARTVEVPVPDENGIVQFDYSIFGKKERKVVSYDTHTCTLDLSEWWNDEFGIAMNLIAVLQEAWSEEPCYLFAKCKLADIYYYARLLVDLLGICPEFVHRGNVWTTYMLLEEEQRQIPFFRALERENQDEFVEFWEKDEMEFSEELKCRFRLWKSMLEAMSNEDAEEEVKSFEPYLAQIVTDMADIWGCRLPDAAWIRKCIENKDDIRYRKALAVLRKMMDEDVEFFPELTARQANAWILRHYRYPGDRTAMSTFLALLSNETHRQEILGF